MDKRELFGEDVKNYEKWRPKYVDSLYNAIWAYIDTTERDDLCAVEIGCGTGQATAPFLEKGICVKAIEISDNMANFVASKFAHYSNFSVENDSFENSHISANSVDIIFSATAFHWIAEKSYPKVFDSLKVGGVLALFWNTPFVAKKDDKLHQEIQRLYLEYEGKNYRKKQEAPTVNGFYKYEYIIRRLENCGFVNFIARKYNSRRVFTAEEYICLLNTYSDHRQMKTEHRLEFEKDIRKIIIDNGNKLVIYDTAILYLVRK